MGIDWRNEEPQIGQWLRLRDGSVGRFQGSQTDGDGVKIWEFQDASGMDRIRVGCPDWKPLVNPQEQKLREERDNLEEKVERLQARVNELSDFEEMYQCVRDERDSLGKQVEELKESQRWRKWPEEVPEKTGYYTIHLAHMKYPVTGWFSVHSGWDVKYKLFWWIKLEVPVTESGGAGE